MFAAAFAPEDIPVYLAPAFGGIALATAPAPAFSIVQAFHTKGPVTDTLLPMAVLDDVGRMPAVKSVVADGFSAWYDFTDTGNRIDRNCPLNRAVFGRVSRRVMKKTKPETLIYVRAEAGGTRG